MAQQIQIRNGTAAEWTAANPILAVGEFALESDTRKFKIGNGSTAWNSLTYATQGEQGPQGDPGTAGAGLEFLWSGTQLGVRVVGNPTYTYVDLKGPQGDVGDTGRGITSVTRTSGTGAQGTTDTYTITYSDSSTSTFSVYNGADGTAPTVTNIGAVINGATAKTTPVDADMIGLMDSAASNVLKKLSWLNLKATLKTYFDTLYNNYVHPTTDGNLHVPATGTTNNGKVLTAGATAGSLSWATPSGGGTTIASEITIADTGGKFTATNVEDALAETATIVSTKYQSDNTTSRTVDLNTLSTPGYYSCTDQCTNKPENAWGSLWVGWISTANWIQQFWIGFNGNVWTRYSVDSGGTRSWNAWRMLYDSRNITRSTADASGGADGDIWFKYTP